MERKDTLRTGFVPKHRIFCSRDVCPQHMANDGSNRSQVLSILFNQ